jgi:hypothetical protein
MDYKVGKSSNMNLNEAVSEAVNCSRICIS